MYAALLLASGMVLHDGAVRERAAVTHSKLQFLGVWSGLVITKRGDATVRFMFFDPAAFEVTIRMDPKNVFAINARDLEPASLQVFFDGTALLKAVGADLPCIWRMESHQIRLGVGLKGRRPDAFVPDDETWVYLLEPERPEKK